MKRTLVAAMAAVAVALCVGANAQQNAQKDEHGHTAAEHAASEKHAHGEKKDLGTTTVAGLKLSVAQMGDAKAGAGAVFEVALDKGQAKPKAIRLWVGNATAEGSVKAKAAGDGPDYDIHVEIPAKLPQDSKLWLEIEPAEGKKTKTALDLKM